MSWEVIQQQVEMVDLGVDLESVELLEAEIDTLMRRLLAIDLSGMTRLERLLHKVRIECIVERSLN